jgi:hypothetical protein
VLLLLLFSHCCCFTPQVAYGQYLVIIVLCWCYCCCCFTLQVAYGEYLVIIVSCWCYSCSLVSIVLPPLLSMCRWELGASNIKFLIKLKVNFFFLFSFSFCCFNFFHFFVSNFLSFCLSFLHIKCPLQC